MSRSGRSANLQINHIAQEQLPGLSAPYPINNMRFTLLAAALVSTSLVQAMPFDVKNPVDLMARQDTTTGSTDQSPDGSSSSSSTCSNGLLTGGCSAGSSSNSTSASSSSECGKIFSHPVLVTVRANQLYSLSHWVHFRLCSIVR